MFAMLIFTGVGIEQSPTREAIDVLRSCKHVFYESYTSPELRPVADELRSLIGIDIQNVTREFVEDGRKILDLAANENVALVSPGDPMIATTHQELRTRAISSNIATKIIHCSSILSALPGELGLHVYSFGKCVTITGEPMQYSAYETIFQNLLLGLHTAVLLEWDEAGGFFLDPTVALAALQSAESDLKYGIVRPDMMILAASRIGREDAKINLFALAELSKTDFGKPPISLVIPGKLHFTEAEAIAALTSRKPESLTDNSANVRRIAEQMVRKYSERTTGALSKARSALTQEQNTKLSTDLLFENVECYTHDAVRFLNQRKDELAVLSMGYAEGLLDSLRFLGILEFEW
jgi:diphthine synthase